MDFLPSVEKGYLPYFLFYAGTSALLHSVFSYTRPLKALVQFGGPNAPPKHSVLAHVYGTKNVYSGLMRLYAAYHISNPQLYSLGMWSFAGVLFLYSTEHLVFRTVGFKEAVVPYLLTLTGLAWMYTQRSWYLA